MVPRPLVALFNVVFAVILGLSPLSPLLANHTANAAFLAAPVPAALRQDDVLFRVRVTFPTSTSDARLAELGVVVLDEDEDSALVLADRLQLADLARLRFEPRSANGLADLVAQNVDSSPWLSGSLSPLWQASEQAVARLARAEGVAAQAEALNDVRAEVKTLTTEQVAAIEALTGVDDDGDGLTNTEEAWWCTNPLNANSDGDAAGHKDGTEVYGVLDFTLPRSLRHGAYGPPFGPPNSWPAWNQAGGCNDGDRDTIPDYAEAYMVGTRVGTADHENTDGDKFDDGQELFGLTYCPGSGNTCGWGLYPRDVDYAFITSALPSWVKEPGDNPFIAAYPVIELAVNPASVRVVTREIRTTERTITQGEEIATGFAETEGKSTTVGTVDTNSHSTWQEHSTTEGGIGAGADLSTISEGNGVFPYLSSQLEVETETGVSHHMAPTNQPVRGGSAGAPVDFASPTVSVTSEIESAVAQALQKGEIGGYLPASGYYAISNIQDAGLLQSRSYRQAEACRIPFCGLHPFQVRENPSGCVGIVGQANRTLQQPCPRCS